MSKLNDMYGGLYEKYKNEWIKKALIRGIVVLIPTYAVAYTTDKMVYVVPMLAAMGFVVPSPS